MAGRAVVLLELDDGGVGVVLAEGQNVLDVGAAPRVDRLVVVADDHEVLVLACEQVGDGVLDAVGVLVLVDADLAEALLVVIEHLGVLREKLEGLDQEVVEVHGVGALEAALQHVVDAGRRAVDGRLRVGLQLLGRDEAVLGLRDLRADRGQRALLLVDVEVAHDVLHEALRVVVVVDREVGLVAQKLAVLAQHAHAHGVEGADPHAAGASRQEVAQTLAHLGGRLVGEGDRQDLPGAHALVVDHVRDAVGEHARLARARAREHEQRPLGALGRLALGGVEGRKIDDRSRAGYRDGRRGCGGCLPGRRLRRRTRPLGPRCSKGKQLLLLR